MIICKIIIVYKPKFIIKTKNVEKNIKILNLRCYLIKLLILIKNNNSKITILEWIEIKIN